MPTREENAQANPYSLTEVFNTNEDQVELVNGLNKRTCIGRVGAPQPQEATSDQFCFWIPPNVLVEKTQLVTCESVIAGKTYKFYAIVDEVRRQSRKRNMGHEVDESDGDVDYEPPFKSEGFTYAVASILRTEVLTPPRERSEVFLAEQEEAFVAYGADEIDRPLRVGLIKNGVNVVAGPGLIDQDYLLGANGGHMNVNGSAGRGTKSSFLLFANWQLINEARRQKVERQSDPERLRIVPIILNVKNYDLFYIDRENNRFDPEIHLNDWKALGIEIPIPFQNVTFYAAQQPRNTLPIPTGRTEGVKPYSWSLRDAIAQSLFPYLFAEVDANDVNFGALVLDIENWLTQESTEGTTTIRTLRSDQKQPATFQALLQWVNEQVGNAEADRILRNHHPSTWRKLHRRLLKLVYESRGVLRREDQRGNPLNVVKKDTSDPIVVDLNALAGLPDLQRFVVATIFRQLVDARTGPKAISGLVYVVTLDELNRFAPRGAHDAITQLIEMVAAEMRSQGVILLGAQQQASKVSEKVIENAAIRVLGRTGTLELSSPVWQFLSSSAKRKAANLSLAEKLVIQDNFREPMQIRVPFPTWAMNRREAHMSKSSDGESDDLASVIDEE